MPIAPFDGSGRLCFTLAYFEERCLYQNSPLTFNSEQGEFLTILSPSGFRQERQRRPTDAEHHEQGFVRRPSVYRTHYAPNGLHALGSQRPIRADLLLYRNFPDGNRYFNILSKNFNFQD